MVQRCCTTTIREQVYESVRQLGLNECTIEDFRLTITSMGTLPHKKNFEIPEEVERLLTLYEQTETFHFAQFIQAFQHFFQQHQDENLASFFRKLRSQLRTLRCKPLCEILWKLERNQPLNVHELAAVMKKVPSIGKDEWAQLYASLDLNREGKIHSVKVLNRIIEQPQQPPLDQKLNDHVSEILKLLAAEKANGVMIQSVVSTLSKAMKGVSNKYNLLVNDDQLTPVFTPRTSDAIITTSEFRTACKILIFVTPNPDCVNIIFENWVSVLKARESNQDTHNIVYAEPGTSFSRRKTLQHYRGSGDFVTW